MENLQHMTTREIKEGIKTRVTWLKEDRGDFGDIGAALLAQELASMRAELKRRRVSKRYAMLPY